MKQVKRYVGEQFFIGKPCTGITPATELEKSEVHQIPAGTDVRLVANYGNAGLVLVHCESENVLAVVHQCVLLQGPKLPDILFEKCVYLRIQPPALCLSHQEGRWKMFNRDRPVFVKAENLGENLGKNDGRGDVLVCQYFDGKPYGTFVRRQDMLCIACRLDEDEEDPWLIE